VTSMKNILMDIDGTICDGQDRKCAAFRECLDQLNIRFAGRLKEPLTMELFWGIVRAQFSVFTGSEKNDLDIRFRMLLSFACMDEKEIESILPELNEIYWKNLSRTCFYPRAKDVINAIKEQGFGVYFFTDSSVEEARFKLNLFPDEFSPGTSKIMITSCEETTDKRIIPIGLEKTGKAYQYLKDEYGAVAMIGDSMDFDIIPARRAGLAAFEVKDGNIESTLDRLVPFLRHLSTGSTGSTFMSDSLQESPP